MNIKSLILGSAAALVAAGSAQAADLPVAEPVDYVKVCDAYGKGYHFIPGTDTCLKISGKVAFKVQQGFINHHATAGNPTSRDNNLIDMDTDVTVAFTAREETELGTLTAHMELDAAINNDGNGRGVVIDKAYLQLGGFYAGHTDSLYDFNAGTTFYDDYGVGNGDLQAMGYKMPLGNGVTVAVALEEYTANQTGARTSMPSVAASLGIKQGWGSVTIGGEVHQVRFANAANSTKLGYSVGGKAEFNLDMLSKGSSIGVAGGYSLGGSLIGNSHNNPGATGARLNSGYAISAGLKYAWNDYFSTNFDGGIETFNDRAATNADWKRWGLGFKAIYKPVKNLEIGAGVGYQKTDFSRANGNRDWDDWAARLEIKRSF